VGAFSISIIWEDVDLFGICRDIFLQQVDKDSSFLESCGIMDYSLLLGIHNVRQPVTHRPSQSAGCFDIASKDALIYVLPFHYNGVPAEVIEGPGRYFFGIIDILQEYNLQKKLERCAKVYMKCSDSRGISSVPPKKYAQRFKKAMKEITDPLLDLEDQKGLFSEVDEKTYSPRSSELPLSNPMSSRLSPVASHDFVDDAHAPRD